MIDWRFFVESFGAVHAKMARMDVTVILRCCIILQNLSNERELAVPAAVTETKSATHTRVTTAVLLYDHTGRQRGERGGAFSCRSFRSSHRVEESLTARVRVPSRDRRAVKTSHQKGSGGSARETRELGLGTRLSKEWAVREREASWSRTREVASPRPAATGVGCGVLVSRMPDLVWQRGGRCDDW